METVRLSSKGQLVIPKHIRDAHSWGPGAEITIEDTKHGVVLRAVSAQPPATIEDAIAALGPAKRRLPLTEANIRAAIARGVKRRHALGRY